MTFQEAKQFIYSLNNIPRKQYMQDAKCHVYLKRLQFFLDILDNPEQHIPHYIHVGGTSGKGSVANFLHAILEQDGKKVGSYISPHPSEITERWKIGKKKMTKKEFAALVEKIKPALDTYIQKSPYDMLSFFELHVAMTLRYFARKKVDWAILEVGCGGKFDGTNVIPYKDVAIVTNVEKDHMHILGSTKKEIAKKKIGIVSENARVYTLEKNRAIRTLLEKETKKKKGASFHYVQHNSRPTISKEKTTFIYKGEQYSMQSLGKHQVSNAILAIDVATDMGLSQKAIKKGIARAGQPLRMEIVQNHPDIILDSAHNPDKMKATVQTTQLLQKNKKQHIHLIIGFSESKDWKKMIQQLAKLKPKTVAITRQTQNQFRKVASPHAIAVEWSKYSLFKAKTKIFLDPQEAAVWSKKQTKKSDILLATGSIFLTGEIARILTDHTI